MGVFSSGGVGIDMGSANVTICLQNEGVVLREPSYVLTLRDDLEEITPIVFLLHHYSRSGERPKPASSSPAKMCIRDRYSMYGESWLSIEASMPSWPTNASVGYPWLR